MLAKRKLLAVLFLAFFAYSNGFSTGYRSMSAPALYQALCGVNAEWRKKPELAETVWSPFEDFSEVSILKTHLMLVEDYLRSNPPAGLDPIQMSRRMHHLDVLKAYWNAGNFPDNPDFTSRTPYFIGKNGNFCAVGYVMWEDGKEEIVKLIEREINNAYVREIPYPELGIWAKENGFLVDELAWIQPGYSANSELQESFWYEHLGGNNYRIWLNTVVPCSGNGYNQTWQDTTGFSFTSVGCSLPQPVGISPWTRAVAYIIYSGCNWNGLTCGTAAGTMGQATIMYKDFTFPVGMCGTWKISKVGGPRLAWGGAGTQTSGGPIWIGNSIIDLSQPNNSPRFTHQIPATIPVSTVQPAKISIGGLDMDGDSLSYHLDTCKIAENTPSPYITSTPYSQASPSAPFGADFPITLDETTGQLTIFPNSQQFASRNGSVCIRVDEHRNGTVINSTYLEFSIDLIGGSPFYNPNFSNPYNITGGTWTNNDRTISMCLGDTLAFSVMLSDSIGDSTIILHDALPVGAAIFNPQTGQPADTIFDQFAVANVRFTPIQAGWYQIPMRGFARRCTLMGVTSTAYRIYVSPAPNPVVQTAMTGCSDAQISVSGLAGYSNWAWSGPYIPQGGGPVVAIQYPGPGTYPFQFEATSQTGCTVHESGTIVVPNIGQPSYSVTTAQTGCLQANFAVSPNGSPINWTYQWSGDGGVSGTGSSASAVYSAAGTYNWSVTVQDSSGCQVTQSNTITVMNDAPGFSASATVSGCSPVVALVSSPTNPNSPFSVEWSGQGGINGNPGRYSNTLTHAFPGPGIYQVWVTYSSALGCDSTAMLQVIIPAIVPNAWAINDTLYTAPGYTYQWYRDSTAIPGANGSMFVPGVSGYYSVYVTDSIGCAGFSVPIYIGITTGLSFFDNTINVYPNPTSDYLMIELSNFVGMAGEFQILDQVGRVLERRDILNNSSNRIDLRSYSSGLYFVKVVSETRTGTKPFQIVR